MLSFAATRKRLPLLRAALRAGADINYTLPPYRTDTPLHLAAAAGDTAIIAELLHHNPLLELPGGQGRTPLLVATANGHQAAVDQLLAAGCNPDAPDDTDTLLVMAIVGDLTPTAFAYIHQIDAHALSRAIECERLSVVELMFARGIPPTIALPLHTAACSGLPYVELCIEHGAREYINAFDEWDMTALAVAAFRGDTEVVRYLIAEGADVNAGSPDNCPVMNAVNRFRTEVVEILLEHGADLSVLRTEEVDIVGVACSDGPAELVGLILDAVDGPLSTDVCLVFVAMANRQLDVVKLLLERGMLVDGREEVDDETALQCAARMRCREGVLMLLDYGADVELLDDELKEVVRKFICQRIMAARKLKREKARMDPRFGKRYV